jgi:hypothetical protein
MPRNSKVIELLNLDACSLGSLRSDDQATQNALFTKLSSSQRVAVDEALWNMYENKLNFLLLLTGGTL